MREHSDLESTQKSAQSLDERFCQSSTGIDCCSRDLERALLTKTTEELHESLSNYLGRYSRDLNEMHSVLRGEFFRSLEIFRQQLNQTLCSRTISTDCLQLANDLGPRFQIMIEQVLVGHTDNLMDISTPIDNLMMQILIDDSCRKKSINKPTGPKLKDFDQELRCHKHCQTRLNSVFDALINQSEQHDFSTNQHNGFEWVRPVNQLDRYKLQYTAELLFTVRLNRLLMQAFELAESMLDGLKEFNAAQHGCQVKLMRMHRCALCHGLIHTRPCPQLCLNILSYCYTPLNELHTAWKNFIDAIHSVIGMFLSKPELSVVGQMENLPDRLLTYFRLLLETHLKLLEPECPGTRRLLNSIQANPSMKTSKTSPVGDSSIFLPYRNVISDVQFRINQMEDLWLRVSSSLCTESAYLVPTNNNVEQCWNGSSLGRFDLEKCDFCDKTTTGTPSSNQADNQLILTTDNYRFIDQISSPTNGRDDRLTPPERANEILVRASGDLQWSADTLRSELGAYEKMFKQFKQAANSQNGENVQNNAVGNAAIVPISGHLHDSHALQPSDGTSDDSLNNVAYASILGWNMRDVEKNRHPIEQNIDPIVRLHLNKDSSEAFRDMEFGQNMLKSINSEGSAVGLDLQNYPWPPPTLVVENPQTTVAKPKVSENLFEGSGFSPVHGPMILEYADYPNVNTFQNFIKSDVSSIDNPTSAIGGLPDDEDFPDHQNSSAVNPTNHEKVNINIIGANQSESAGSHYTRMTNHLRTIVLVGVTAHLLTHRFY